MAARTQWTPLHDRFYRKVPVYDGHSSGIQWDLSDAAGGTMLACCPLAGPVAVYRASSSTSNARNHIAIYSLAGQLLYQIPLDRPARLIRFGWIENERLLCVYDDAMLMLYSIDGQSEQYSLPKNIETAGISDARFSQKGLAIMTDDFKFFWCYLVDGVFKCKTYSDFGLIEPPQCWDLLCIYNDESASKPPDLVVSARNSLWVLDTGSVIEQQLNRGMIRLCSVSPNGKFVALYGADGRLLVVSSDFQQFLLEFPAKSKTIPSQLCWCGSDSVVLRWKELFLIIGPFGDWIKYSFDDEVFLSTEIDGLRIIQQDRCEFLERVPDAVEETFKLGSTKPSALLLDAADLLNRGDAKADELLRSIRPFLAEATEACISAAIAEQDIQLQKSVLTAAHMGRAFIGNQSADTFIRFCKQLRVLNCLRESSIAIPLTYLQLEKLGHKGLIKRLMTRRQYLLALRICEHLGIKSNEVFAHWLSMKIRSSNQSDEILCQEIVSRLKGQSTISFSDTALLAFDSGRVSLAKNLLEMDPSLLHRVPLFLKMQEHSLALTAALKSGDIDVVCFVLLTLKHRLPLADFFRICNSHPLCACVVRKLFESRNLELYRDFLYQGDRKFENALSSLRHSVSEKSISQRTVHQKIAASTFSTLKFASNISIAVDEQMKLQLVQMQLERETSYPLLDLSLSDTIISLIRIGHGSKIGKLQADFKIPEKRMWVLKVSAFASIQDWTSLDKLAKSKKSPIGYDYFVDQCIHQNNFLEAKKYILKCDVNQRSSLFLKIGEFRDAAQAAFTIKDVTQLRLLRSKCNDTTFVDEISRMIMKLGLRE